MAPAIGIELTNHCNLKCPECAAGSGLMKRGRGFMELSLFDRILSELRPYLYNLNLYFQGEPLMHPSFPLFIRKSRGIHSIISTNGHYLSPENCESILQSGLSKLIISLDGTDQSTYSAYRVNGNIEKALQGIKNFGEHL